MERRLVTVRESGNGYVCTLEVPGAPGTPEMIMVKEMLVVGSDMGCLGEAVVELFKLRIRDRKKKATPAEARGSRATIYDPAPEDGS